MDSENAIKIIEANPELVGSLEEALRNNADEKKLADILHGAGLDADVACELLAEIQRRRGAAIGIEDIDPEQLGMIAGGGTGVSCSNAGDCDKHFKECSSGFLYSERCYFFDNCDENFGGKPNECLRYDKDGWL